MRRDVLLYAQSVRVRGVLREVLTPRARPRLFASMDGSQRYLHGDAGGFIRLAEMAALAASERESLLWIPPGKVRPAELPGWEGERGWGILLVNHAAQFQPSDWRDARSRLGTPRATRRQIEIRRDPDLPWYAYRTDREDAVTAAEHADTFVFAGNRRSFRALAEELWEMGRGGFGPCTDLDLAVKVHRDHRDDVFLYRHTRWQEGPPFYRSEFHPARGDTEATIRRMAGEGWRFVRKGDRELIFQRPLR